MYRKKSTRFFKEFIYAYICLYIYASSGFLEFSLVFSGFQRLRKHLGARGSWDSASRGSGRQWLLGIPQVAQVAQLSRISQVLLGLVSSSESIVWIILPDLKRDF